MANKKKNLANLLEILMEPKEPMTIDDANEIYRKILDSIKYVKGSIEALYPKVFPTIKNIEFNNVEELVIQLLKDLELNEQEKEEKKEEIEKIFYSARNNLNRNLFKNPKIRPVTMNVPVPVSPEFCKRLNLNLEDIQIENLFDKFVLEIFTETSLEDKSGNIISYILTKKICNPEEIKKIEKEYEIKNLILLYKSLIYPKSMNLDTRKINVDTIKPIWERYHEDPLFKEIIKNSRNENDFFHSDKLENAKKNRQQLSGWKKMFFDIYDELASGQRLQEPSPSAIAVGREPASFRQPAISESLQLKKLSLKEAMEIEYD